LKRFVISTLAKPVPTVVPTTMCGK
jgi:hypothetical protein